MLVDPSSHIWILRRFDAFRNIPPMFRLHLIQTKATETKDSPLVGVKIGRLLMSWIAQLSQTPWCGSGSSTLLVFSGVRLDPRAYYRVLLEDGQRAHMDFHFEECHDQLCSQDCSALVWIESALWYSAVLHGSWMTAPMQRRLENLLMTIGKCRS